MPATIPVKTSPEPAVAIPGLPDELIYVELPSVITEAASFNNAVQPYSFARLTAENTRFSLTSSIEVLRSLAASPT